jgi:progressive ankylosis protein
VKLLKEEKISLSSNHSKVSLWDLWREFLPLSLSDVTMACGDPAITSTLAHLPNAQGNLAALGIAKSLAVFFESPIISILHASNALAAGQASRKALWRFTLLIGIGLTILLLFVGSSLGFELIGVRLLNVPKSLAPEVQQILLIMGGWPFVIAWRRYFQGLLIYHGQAQAIAKASFARLMTLGLVLGVGYWLKISGTVLAGVALMIGVLVESVFVTCSAYKLGAVKPPQTLELSPNSPKNLPKNLREIGRFYLPLANSMLVVWGGRALLIGILVQAQDAMVAIAAWTSAWGLVLVIANSTRMVQQIVIKYRHQVSEQKLLIFASIIGASCSLLLLGISISPLGEQIIQSFIGGDRILAQNMKSALLLCTGIPFLVALQNAIQGLFISDGKTGQVNLVTWLCTGTLLLIAYIFVQQKMNGTMAAAIAMSTSMLVEVCYLFWKRKVNNSQPS